MKEANYQPRGRRGGLCNEGTGTGSRAAAVRLGKPSGARHYVTGRYSGVFHNSKGGASGIPSSDGSPSGCFIPETGYSTASLCDNDLAGSCRWGWGETPEYRQILGEEHEECPLLRRSVPMSVPGRRNGRWKGRRTSALRQIRAADLQFRKPSLCPF